MLCVAPDGEGEPFNKLANNFNKLANKYNKLANKYRILLYAFTRNKFTLGSKKIFFADEV
jgi:hypothetical protein